MIVDRFAASYDYLACGQIGGFSKRGFMNAVEFTTELGPNGVLLIPQSAAGKLPTSGTARVIVLVEDAAGDEAVHDLAGGQWHEAAYGQFLADDDGQDDIYESCR